MGHRDAHGIIALGDGVRGEAVPLRAEDKGEPPYRFHSELVMPIVSQGDPIGAVVICGSVGLEEVDRKVAQSAAGVLARQMMQ